MLNRPTFNPLDCGCRGIGIARVRATSSASSQSGEAYAGKRGSGKHIEPRRQSLRIAQHNSTSRDPEKPCPDWSNPPDPAFAKRGISPILRRSRVSLRNSPLSPIAVDDNKNRMTRCATGKGDLLVRRSSQLRIAALCLLAILPVASQAQSEAKPEQVEVFGHMPPSKPVARHPRQHAGPSISA
jgi:hypothetical protein